MDRRAAVAALGRLFALAARWGMQEPLILAALLVAAGSAWLFIAIADEVSEGDTLTCDEWLLLALRSRADPADPLGPAWFEEMMRDFTALGGVGVLALMVLSAAGFLLMQGKRRAALLVLSATGSGALLGVALKLLFARPRPDLVPYASQVYSASFPSGHSLLAAVVYLTLGALLARVQPNRRLKVYLMGWALLMTLLVGVSRVYLGVHWPTDVLAGWTAGAAWAAMCWVVVVRGGG